jgi:hypothetical protein
VQVQLGLGQAANEILDFGHSLSLTGEDFPSPKVRAGAFGIGNSAI